MSLMESSQQPSSFNTEEDSRFVNKKTSNIKSDLIEITEDKLENILLKHLKKMGTRKGWIAPLGLFISVVLANTTAIFAEKFGIPSSTWEALFILSAIASGIWLAVSIVMIFVNWKESSIECLIGQVKNSSAEKGVVKNAR
jgi:hypothetical protein